MACLANDATSPHGAILCPVIGWNSPRIHRHDEALGFLHWRQQHFHLLHLRRKTTVETHHHLRAAIWGARLRRVISSAHSVQALQIDGQRLLDKHMLARLQRLHYKT